MNLSCGVDDDGTEIVVDGVAGALELQADRRAEFVQVLFAGGGEGPQRGIGGTAVRVGGEHFRGIVPGVETDGEEVAAVFESKPSEEVLGQIEVAADQRAQRGGGAAAAPDFDPG